MKHEDRQAYAEAFRRKAKGYDIDAVRRAVVDIDATLAIHDRRQTNNEASDYVTRLWLERDAMTERFLAISRQITRERQAAHESRWHTAASGQPLDTEE